MPIGRPLGRVTMRLITFSMIGDVRTWESMPGAMGRRHGNHARKLHDSWGEAMGHMVAGNAYLLRRDLRRLASTLSSHLGCSSENQLRIPWANIGRSGLAETAWRQGDHLAPRPCIHQVINLWRLADQRGGIARCLECIGFIAGHQARDAAEQIAAAASCNALRRRRVDPPDQQQPIPWEQAEYDGYLANLATCSTGMSSRHVWRTGQQMDLDQGRYPFRDEVIAFGDSHFPKVTVTSFSRQVIPTGSGEPRRLSPLDRPATAGSSQPLGRNSAQFFQTLRSARTATSDASASAANAGRPARFPPAGPSHPHYNEMPASIHRPTLHLLLDAAGNRWNCSSAASASPSASSANQG